MAFEIMENIKITGRIRFSRRAYILGEKKIKRKRKRKKIREKRDKFCHSTKGTKSGEGDRVKGEVCICVYMCVTKGFSFKNIWLF